MGRTLLCSVLVVAVVVPRLARAGVELTTEVTIPGGKPDAPRPGRMLLDGDRVRMELTRAATPEAKTVMIYRGDRNLVWSLDDKRRTYSEIDGARMQAMRQRSEGARERMRGELEKLPPDKRAQMQRMLAAADTANATRQPPTVKETGRSDKVGTLACHEVEVSRAGAKESEICVADWKTAGVTKEDLAPVRKLGAFQDSAAGPQGRSQGGDILELFDALDGLPVRVRTFRRGELQSEFRVTKVEHKPIDAKLFDPPDGYTRRVFDVTMPGAPGGRPNAPAPPSAPAPEHE